MSRPRPFGSESGMTILEMAMSMAVIGVLIVMIAGISQSIRKVNRSPEAIVQQILQELQSDFLLTGKFSRPDAGKRVGMQWVGRLRIDMIPEDQANGWIYAVNAELLDPPTTRLATFNKLGEPAMTPGRPTALVAAVPMNPVVEQCMRLFRLADASLKTPGAQTLVVRISRRTTSQEATVADQGLTALDLYSLRGCPGHLENINKWVNAFYLFEGQKNLADLKSEITSRRYKAAIFAQSSYGVRLLLWGISLDVQRQMMTESLAQLFKSKITGKAAFLSGSVPAGLALIQYTYGEAFTIAQMVMLQPELKKLEQDVENDRRYATKLGLESAAAGAALVRAYQEAR